jgi:hypothetical protein
MQLSLLEKFPAKICTSSTEATKTKTFPQLKSFLNCGGGRFHLLGCSVQENTFDLENI